MHRIAEGQKFCGAHGGQPFEPRYINTPRVAGNQRDYRYRLLVEDLFVHLNRCPACSKQALAKPLWTQSAIEITGTSLNCCEEGHRICGLVAEALRDLGSGRLITPRTPLEQQFIAQLILHTRACKVCRPNRDELAIWDWSEQDREQFSRVCCPSAKNILTLWYQSTLSRRAA